MDGSICTTPESPIEPKDRNDKKYILMRMRRNLLRVAAGIAEATYMKVLIEERSTLSFDTFTRMGLINEMDKPSWLVVRMRLGTPGSKEAKTKAWVSGRVR